MLLTFLLTQQLTEFNDFIRESGIFLFLFHLLAVVDVAVLTCSMLVFKFAICCSAKLKLLSTDVFNRSDNLWTNPLSHPRTAITLSTTTRCNTFHEPFQLDLELDRPVLYFV